MPALSRLAAAIAPVLLLAPLFEARASAEEPFTCTGYKRTAERTYPVLVSGGPPGRLEVKLLAGPAPGPPKSEGQESPAARFAVSATHARVFDLAAALSERLQMRLWVAPSVSEARISMQFRELDLARLTTVPEDT